MSNTPETYLKKFAEEHQRIVDSDFMQQLIKSQKDLMVRMKPLVNSETLKQIQKLAGGVAPAFIKFPIIEDDAEQIIASKEVFDNPDSKPEEVIDSMEKVEKVATRNPSKQTRLILQDLIPYFENNLPYRKKSDYPDIDIADYNKKITTHCMQDIATEYELSLRQIQRIASQYKDCYVGFLPSKK